jgi:hypothetical protein
MARRQCPLRRLPARMSARSCGRAWFLSPLHRDDAGRTVSWCSSHSGEPLPEAISDFLTECLRRCANLVKKYLLAAPESYQGARRSRRCQRPAVCGLDLMVLGGCSPALSCRSAASGSWLPSTRAPRTVTGCSTKYSASPRPMSRGEAGLPRHRGPADDRPSPHLTRRGRRPRPLPRTAPTQQHPRRPTQTAPCLGSFLSSAADTDESWAAGRGLDL